MKNKINKKPARELSEWAKWWMDRFNPRSY